MGLADRRSAQPAATGAAHYGVTVWAKRELGASTAVAVVAGVLGAVVVWLHRTDPRSCITLDDGIRACMPVHVVAPPLWLYAAVAVSCAFLAGGMTLVCTLARRARSE